MCGIAGAVSHSGGAIERTAVEAMLARLRHRGPDDEGVWDEAGVCLGQRRLAIIDLSQAGHQPMVSACGRWVITVNGEIYNYKALRSEIDAVSAIRWRGSSDTEVLLEAIAAFGLEAALEKACGMFAFALYDRGERRMALARDRFGEKPLYYTTLGGGLTFASELTALAAAPGLDLELSRTALGLFFRYGYVPAPLSIYEDVHKLPPGCRLDWRAGEAAVVTPYWRLSDLVEAGRSQPLTDTRAATSELDGLLRTVVGEQMISDVPLGVFLSGGIDSSTIAAVMQQVSPVPVKTFTIGFASPEFNEAEHAAAVARHLKTDHTEHYVTGADARAVVPGLGAVYDEPFADPSQIPTLLLSAMARRHVTVCLTGDGGDEMFAGYVRYTGAPRLWNAIARIPMRRGLAALIGATPLPVLEAGLGFLRPLARQYASRGMLGPSVRRAAGWIGAASQEELYERTMSAWTEPEDLMAGPSLPPARWRPASPEFEDDLEAMQWRDSVDYLPGDILCKVDRAAMAHSLETRVPLLDRRVADFAWRAPASMKIRGGVGKWLLRQVLHRYVPRALIERPKLGFSVPLHAWLTGDLRDWAESLISPAMIRRQGLLNPKPIEKLWKSYLAGDTSADHKVWTLLMFQSWLAARA
ncbi:MAG: asparagine synthase (glutamine-hydrolyzing) [Caulobacteraceae bacterium]